MENLNFEIATNMIKGRKTILEALDNNVTINKLYVSKVAKGSIIANITRVARKKGIVLTYLPPKEIDRKAGKNNQGVLALISPIKYAEFSDFINLLKTNQKKNINTVFVILDSVTDPHNVGAIIRSAYALGIDGIILPKRNSCLVNATVMKASAGAANMLPILQVNNLVQTITKLKKYSIWVVGAEINGDEIKKLPLKGRNLCIILGSEGSGIRHLVKENCDYLIKIPLKNNFDSLNVSAAASIFFYELV
ncbi:MAG: 23S rRNA (guanosine(2251)-2'-O)-methyltransferase RlmB [Bacteroidetes bacterium]|nr:23S rRNA (guanosine(2251)-2'-O)-methyltransferase RlmB [Bacteroidota bacterium]